VTTLLADYWPILIAIAAIVAAVLIGLSALGDRKRLPYEKRTSLLTQSELAFYRVLQEAVDGRWAIHTMVRMADLIRVRPETPKFQAWQNRIHAKHIDFLLCDQGTLEAKLALELDDRSHLRPDRARRDLFVNQALSDAGLPLLRVDVQKDYDVEQLRQTISKQIV
jgi:very-short-patch-repair endonuclease